MEAQEDTVDVVIVEVSIVEWTNNGALQILECELEDPLEVFSVIELEIELILGTLKSSSAKLLNDISSWLF